MCQICGRFYCPSGCPNAPEPEPEVFARCDACDDEIYDGEDYYEIGDCKYCEACVEYGRKTAEVY